MRLRVPLLIAAAVVVAVALVATAAMASGVPARRASRVDPVESLRRD